ncbi:MAG: helix-turn-helix transcriptional regulator [Verrucomicrobiota bacterium]
MTADELTKCVEAHEKNASQIAADIGVGRSAMSNWMNGKRSIDAPTAKLLRLYFYGEIPFENIRSREDLTDVLRFSQEEWHIIAILARRIGLDPGSWIAEQIRTIIAGRALLEPGLFGGKNGTDG